MKNVISILILIVLLSCDINNDNKDFNFNRIIESYNLQNDLIEKDCKEFREYITSSDCYKIIQISKNGTYEIPCYDVEIFPSVHEDFSIHIDSSGNIFFNTDSIQFDNLDQKLQKYFESQDGSKRNYFI